MPWARAFLTVILLSIFAARAWSVLAAPHADLAATDAFFTNEAIHVLKIEIPTSGMNALRRDPRTYVRATLREGGQTYTNVSVRLKGGAGSFRPLDDKPGLTLRLDEGRDSFHGLRKFHLNNSVQDNTYLSEWLCSDLFRQAGVPAPQALPVLVELNRRRLGLFVLLESVDSPFLSRTFANTHGNVYSPPWNADVTQRLECIGGRETNNFSDLKALAAAARTPGTNRLAQVLDVDRFISFMALEVMLCHWDGYTSNIKNYLLYHDPAAEKMVFIPHDMDQMLQDPNRPVVPRPKGLVSRAILADPTTRKRYLERFGELYTRTFVAPVLIRRIDTVVKKLGPGIQAYDAELGREFVSNAGDLKARIVSRARGLQGQLGALAPNSIHR